LKQERTERIEVKGKRGLALRSNVHRSPITD